MFKRYIVYVIYDIPHDYKVRFKLLSFFLVDKSEAGVADLEVQVVTPSEVVMPLEVKSGPAGEAVEWVPDAPGQYRVTIFYGGEEVSKSSKF